jgi:hypothetical protein
MEELNKILTNPFDGLTTKALQNKCREIAESLFCNYCINCNGTEYYFAEVEFYYWQKDKWDEKWNRITYPRNSEAGKLFFHLSGIDICFNSDYNEAKFGGILIRAIMDENNIVTAGPLTCKDLLLNSCHGQKMPKLQKSNKSREWTPQVLQTKRMLGKTDMNNKIDKDLELCFYDSSISIEEWNAKRKWYDKHEGCEKDKIGTYRTDRFNKQEQ